MDTADAPPQKTAPMSRALIVAALNVLAVGAVVAERELELISSYPWLRIVMTPFFVWVALLGFFALCGVVLGIRELRGGMRTKSAWAGTVLNLLFVLWFVMLLVYQYLNLSQS